MLRNFGVVPALIALAAVAGADAAEQDQNDLAAKASALIGRNVISSRDVVLGDVYDLVVDFDGGRVSHLVLAEGGVLGIGATLRPVPIEAAQLKQRPLGPGVGLGEPGAPPATRPTHREWVLQVDVTQERFEEAPVLEDDWNVLGDPEWAAELDAFYGLEDIERDQERPIYRVSQLTGSRIRDRDDERNLGSLTEIVFDLEAGSIRYGTLSYGGFLGFGDTLVAVPWEAFTLQEVEGWFEYQMVLDATEETVQEATGFDQDDWPRFADPELAEALGVQDGSEQGRARGDLDVEVGPDGVEVDVDVDLESPAPEQDG